MSKPLAPERYDMIFDMHGSLLRIQCKWASHRGEVVVIRCRSSRRVADGHARRDYTADEVDANAAYCLPLDRCNFFGVCGASPAAIQSRLSPSKNDQRMGVNWAATSGFGNCSATMRSISSRLMPASMSGLFAIDFKVMCWTRSYTNP